MRKIIYLLFLLILFPIRVGAIHEVIDSRCTNSLKSALREEAQGVVYRLSKVASDDGVTYTAYFYNMTDNMYIIDSKENIYSNLRIDNLKPGTRFVINMYASNKTYCEGYKVSSRVISVPHYNPYFGSELCNGYENFSLCKEDVNVNLSQDEFEVKLSTYKDSLKEKEEENISDSKVVEEDTFNLYDFVVTYKYYIVGILCIILFTIITVSYVNHKKRGGIL